MSAYDLTDEQATWPRTDLLSPGTLTRPDHLRREDWARMGWHAKWKATRADLDQGRRKTPSVTTADELIVAEQMLKRCVCGSWMFIGDTCMTCARVARRARKAAS